MENQYWYLILLIFLGAWCLSQYNTEKFVSGTEKMILSYDEDIYPLDHPKYITPQQRYFQISLSEHSALDSNLQNIRKDIATQQCRTGTHCFDTREWHTLNNEYSSSPDIINSRVDHPKQSTPSVIYTRHQGNKVVPQNSTCQEMRADLYDDIVLPELFFKRKVSYNPKTEAHPDEKQYLTNIY